MQTFSLNSLVQVTILKHSLKNWKKEAESQWLKLSSKLGQTRLSHVLEMACSLVHGCGLQLMEIYFSLEATSLFVPETFKFKFFKRDF